MPIWFKPQAKLFISVDLVDSTSMKHLDSSIKIDAEFDFNLNWYQQTLRFYYGFNQLFLKEISKLQKHLASANTEKFMRSLPSPNIWKVIGDELLYECDINNEFEIYHLLICFSEAIQKFSKSTNDGILKLAHNHELKGTAWISSFPVVNKMIFIRPEFLDVQGKINDSEEYWMLDQLNLSYENKNSGTVRVDYIGPSIDTGFRIKNFSTPRKMMISADLALVISSAIYDMNNENRFRTKTVGDLYFEGLVNIKGVSKGKDYPLFWIDITNSKKVNTTFCYESMLDIVENRSPLKPEIVLSFLQSFFATMVNELLHPYIPGSRKYGTPTRSYKELQEKHRKVYEKEMKRAERLNTNLGLNNPTKNNNVNVNKTEESDDAMKIVGRLIKQIDNNRKETILLQNLSDQENPLNHVFKKVI